MRQSWPWAALAVLGAYHGLNPGMGWLFAVARGLQEQRRSKVLSSLLPIAAGHEASIAVVVGLVAVAQLTVAPRLLPVLAAAALVGFGLLTVWRRRSHPRGFGMRIGTVGLVIWSFLMSSAHGAGLMLVPLLLQLPVVGGGPHDAWLLIGPFAPGLLAASLHTAVMLLVMGLVALVVYNRFGVGFLRKAWFNMDLIWAVTLITAGIVTLLT
jgi:hypothetical protein